jgi:integrase
VPDSKTINGIREVPLSDRALGVLRKRCGTRRNGWLFLPIEAFSGRSPDNHGNQVSPGARGAGLPKNLVLYCGRHDFGTRLLDETKNLKLVMQVVGHVDVKTAMKYQHPETDVARAALNRTAPEWHGELAGQAAMAHFTAHLENVPTQ